jgi:DNA mismatch repair protein MSH4
MNQARYTIQAEAAGLVLRNWQILVPQTSVTPVKSTLLSIIEHYMPDVTISPAPRKYYSEQAGHEYIQQLACADDLAGIMVAISAKFYAVSAAAAALKHISLSTQFQMHTLRVKYQGSEGEMPSLQSDEWPLMYVSRINDD